MGGPSLQVSADSAIDLVESRRVVTVLFADLSGSTGLAERLDPEDLREVLTAFFGALAREIHRYGGSLDKYVGDAVMAVFGAPLAHEDDAQRAISAAIAMHAAIGQLNEDLQQRYGARLALRIGINSGEVVAGLLGGEVQAYTVVGDTVNTAQRFEAAAQPGSTLVSHATQHLTRGAFDFQALPPLRLRGKAELQPAFRVLGPRYESIDPTALPLVGRTAELACLREAFAAACARHGGMVHLVGDSGIGKSRLVRELRASLPSDVVQVVGRCVSFEVDRPLALLARLVRDVVRVPSDNHAAAAAEIIQQVLSALGPVDPSEVALLLEAMGYGQRSEYDPRLRQRLLVNLVRRLLQAYAEISPLLIVAEDLQWADPASTALLAELARDIPGRPCLLLSTSRPGALPPWPVRVLALEALAREDARALVESALGGPAHEDLSESILARTGGNPFFIEEVIRGLRQADALLGMDGRLTSRSGASTRLPESLQELLEARLDRLRPAARRVLQVAAVCGRVFRWRVVERLAPEATKGDSLAELEREGLILTHAVEPEATYTFRHALIQEVAYNRQLQSQRRATHAAVADALQALYPDRLEELVGELAFHYSHGPDHARAVEWLLRAGERARAMYANREATTSYQAALDRARAAGDVAAASHIQERLGELHLVGGRYDEALVNFGAALASAAPGAVARLNRQIGATLLLKGAYGDAAVALQAGLSASSAPGDVELGRIHMQLAQLHLRRGDFEAAREQLSRAAQLAAELDDQDLLAESHKQLGNLAFHTGDLKSAASEYEHALRLGQGSTNPARVAEVRNNLGLVYRRAARWEEAMAEFDAGLALWERIGNPWGVALCHNNMGEVERSRGRAAEAIASFERALAGFQALGAATEEAITLIGLGAARVEGGEVILGRVELQLAARRLEALGSAAYLPDVYRYLATGELLSGELVAAERAALRSLDFAHAGTAPHQEAATMRVMGEIALARGQASLARALLELSRQTLAELGDTLELARTQAVLARASEAAAGGGVG
ncbi:MAG: AAA family ATPase [Chloroflexota bacterium]|nr:AAA family ATPase [Chloroflexota bacterium]